MAAVMPSFITKYDEMLAGLTGTDTSGLSGRVLLRLHKACMILFKTLNVV